MDYEGPLTRISLLQAADAPDLHRLIDRNREHLSRFVITGIEYPDFQSVLASIIHPRPHELRFGIWNHSRELVGFIKLKLVSEAYAEIEGWLGAEFTRRGYMTEAIGIMLQTAYRDLGCQEVLARVAKANSPSLSLVAKHGFRAEPDPRHPDMYLLRHQPLELPDAAASRPGACTWSS